MKKVLFATTALVATASIAAADVSLSGAANFGIVDNGTAGAEAEMYNNASITATMSGATDNGLTFGASMTVRVGDDVEFAVGDLGDNDPDNTGNIAGFTSDVNFGNIFVTGSWGTLTFDRGGIDNLHNDDFSHDVMYTYSVGGLSIGATVDVDNNGGTYADGEQYSLSVVYNAAPVTLTVKTDDSSEYDFTAAYALNDAIGMSINYDTDGQSVNSVAESETILKVTFKEGDLSGHVAVADDKDDQWEIGLGYSANNLTVGAVIAENDGSGDTETDLTASYDLGGGMSIRAATNESGAYFVGAALKF